jgi:hypothetical protein
MNADDEQLRAFDEALAALDAARTEARKNHPEGQARFDSAETNYCEALRSVVRDEELAARWQQASRAFDEAGERAERLGRTVSDRGRFIDDEEIATWKRLKDELHAAFIEFDDIDKEVLQILDARRQALREKRDQ